MPKIRALKPEFWTDKNVVRLTPHARLLFMGLWNFASDCGHVEDEPIELKMRILPADNCDVDELLSELASSGRIERQDGWITLLRFAEHQKLDKRYFTACQPCKTRGDHAEQTPPQAPSPEVNTTGSHRGHTVVTSGPRDGGDGDGDGDREVIGAADKPPKRRVKLPTSWMPTGEHLQRAVAAGVNLAAEADKFRIYNETHDRRVANWNSAFTQWLIKAAEFAERDKPSRTTSNLRPVADIAEPPDGLTDAEYRTWWQQQKGAR